MTIQNTNSNATGLLRRQLRTGFERYERFEGFGNAIVLRKKIITGGTSKAALKWRWSRWRCCWRWQSTGWSWGCWRREGRWPSQSAWQTSQERIRPRPRVRTGGWFPGQTLLRRAWSRAGRRSPWPSASWAGRSDRGCSGEGPRTTWGWRAWGARSSSWWRPSFQSLSRTGRSTCWLRRSPGSGCTCRDG